MIGSISKIDPRSPISRTWHAGVEAIEQRDRDRMLGQIPARDVDAHGLGVDLLHQDIRDVVGGGEVHLFGGARRRGRHEQQGRDDGRRLAAGTSELGRRGSKHGDADLASEMSIGTGPDVRTAPVDDGSSGAGMPSSVVKTGDSPGGRASGLIEEPLGHAPTFGVRRPGLDSAICTTRGISAPGITTSEALRSRSTFSRLTGRSRSAPDSR